MVRIMRRKPGKRRRWSKEDEASWESFPASDPPAWTTGQTEDKPVSKPAKKKKPAKPKGQSESPSK